MAEMYDLNSLSGLSEDFKRLQQQKNRKTGGVEARVLLALAFTWGEQYVSQTSRGVVAEALHPNKLNLVFNLIGPNVSKLLGRLFAFDPPFKARPDKKEPKAFAEAEVVDKVLLALDEIVDQSSRLREILYWLIVGGTAFEYVSWIPNAGLSLMPQFVEGTDELLLKDLHTGQILPESAVAVQMQMGVPKERFNIYEEVEMAGEVGSEVFGPLNVFVDQSVKSLDALSPDQMVYLAKIRTLGWIIENFPQLEEQLENLELDSDVKIVSTACFQDGDATASLFLNDMIPTVQGSVGDDDPPVAVVVEGFAPVSRVNPNGRYVVFVPDKLVLHDGENPYEDREIPIVDFHFDPTVTTFWSKDYVTDLIAPQRFINKRMSQMGEQANSTIAAKTLVGNPVTKEDVLNDAHSVIEKAVSETGQPLVQIVEPPSLPTWFLESINVTNKFMQADIAGGKELTDNSSFPGQLRGPMAVPMMQEIMDTRWGPLYRHLGRQMSRVKQLRLNRVKQFYPAVRTLHFTDKNQKDEVLVFHAEQILRSNTNYNITVERGSLVPELRSLREARVRERLDSSLRVLYEDDRTGRIDKSKVAADLQFTDEGREGREANARKFAQEIIDMLWEGHQVPPVMPFWDHAPMMDELEATMMTTEFLRASPQIQQLFLDRWNAHAQELQKQFEQQQSAQQSAMVQDAVAQATQQAAAQAASETVESVLEQLRAVAGVAPDTADQLRSNLQEQGGFPRGITGRSSQEGRAAPQRPSTFSRRS